MKRCCDLCKMRARAVASVFSPRRVAAAPCVLPLGQKVLLLLPVTCVVPLGSHLRLCLHCPLPCVLPLEPLGQKVMLPVTCVLPLGSLALPVLKSVFVKSERRRLEVWR